MLARVKEKQTSAIGHSNESTGWDDVGGQLTGFIEGWKDVPMWAEYLPCVCREKHTGTSTKDFTETSWRGDWGMWREKMKVTT